jgi:hypothetical protein
MRHTRHFISERKQEYPANIKMFFPCSQTIGFQFISLLYKTLLQFLSQEQCNSTLYNFILRKIEAS